MGARMHERTERALCRLAFLVLCALPTFAIMAITFVTWTPWYHQRQIRKLEQVLTQRLGVTVAIADMQRPTPTAWQLFDVKLSDPETGSRVATVRRASYVKVAGEVRLHLAQPEIQSNQLNLVWRVIHDRFLCQPDLLGQRLRLRAQDLSLLSHPQGMTLSPVDVWIEPRADETRAVAQFFLAGWNPDEKPAQLAVTRFRGEDKPRTVWELQTGSSPLPCSVLADHLPVMRRLGVDAEFRGLLRWQLNREDYSVKLSEAHFTKVNMLELFEPFDYHVSGMGTIDLQSLVRHSGRPISEAVGKLTIVDGRVEVGLLRRLVQSLNAQMPSLEAADRERIDCDLVAAEFQLFGNEVQVAGTCYRQPNYESSSPGTAIIANNRPLLSLDPRHWIASSELTSTIDPRGRVGLPLGNQEHWMRGLIPQVDQVDQAPSVGRLRLNR